MSISVKQILKGIKEYLIITLGILLYVFSWTAFLIPKGIAGGSSTGLATVIQFATNGLIPVSASYLVINFVLIALGTIILGRGFGAKTIFSIVMATIFFEYVPEYIPYVSDVQEPFINAILGGTISALGIYLVFSQGGSTGGTDIVALIVNKFHEVAVGKVYLLCDLVIVSSIFFLPGKSLSDVVYGYLQMISFSFAVDLLLTGSKQSVQLLIFSGKYSEIADALVQNANLGVTSIKGTGWYSKAEGNILIVVARKNRLADITRTVKGIDQKAFISVTQVMSVYGRGFEQLKEGKISWKKKK